MKKYIFIVSVILLFGLTGCEKDASTPVIKKSSIKKDLKVPQKLDQKTEDELAQKDFEKLISEPTPKKKISTEKVIIKGADLGDIEILDITNTDLNSIK